MTENDDAGFPVTCLFCGLVQVCHTNADGDSPQPGDISICYDCGYVTAYGEDLQLVPLTSEQQAYVESNVKFQATMAALRTMREQDVNKDQ